ncbi:ATP-binding protein [Sphaerisporangium album]|nr:ATP-binding protein [Sphaerisporangium album]
MTIQMAAADHRIGQDGDMALLGQKWIPGDEKCIASARRFVRDIANDWSAAGDVPDLAELLTSEVVTNALVHGAPHLPGRSTVRISVGRDGPLMTVDVYDSCIAVPHMRTAGSMETSGRGLAIVEALACKWGWNLHRQGKSVWFQLTAWPPSLPGGALKLLA